MFIKEDAYKNLSELRALHINGKFHVRRCLFLFHFSKEIFFFIPIINLKYKKFTEKIMFPVTIKE